MTSATAVRPSPCLLLDEHHHALEAACRDLRADVYADDQRALIQRYRCFEQAVNEHLDVEDRELLPDFTDHSMLDARQIRIQHLELRDRLYRLGIDVELHRARAERFEAMVDLLQRHVAEEEATLYPWARTHLPLHSRRVMFVRLGRSLRRLANLRPVAA